MAIFTKGPHRPRIPDGLWLAAIGDIHGEVDCLRRLRADLARSMASSRAKHRQIVYLGDYIDRGGDSRGVIDLLLEERLDAQEIFLLGNHEAFMLAFMHDKVGALPWLANGGEETCLSYGIDPSRPTAGKGLVESLWSGMSQAVPARHLSFLKALLPMHEAGDYLFVHAGIRPGVALAEQSLEDLLWIRDDFVNSKLDHGKVIVHGHTPDSAPVVRKNRIGIDTGACYGGSLTALILEGEDRAFLFQSA